MLEQCYNIYITYIQHLKTTACAYFQIEANIKKCAIKQTNKKKSSQQVEKPATGDSSDKCFFVSDWKDVTER